MDSKSYWWAWFWVILMRLILSHIDETDSESYSWDCDWGITIMNWEHTWASGHWVISMSRHIMCMDGFWTILMRLWLRHHNREFGTQLSWWILSHIDEPSHVLWFYWKQGLIIRGLRVMFISHHRHGWILWAITPYWVILYESSRNIHTE